MKRAILSAAIAATALLPHDFGAQARAAGDSTMQVAAADTMRVLWIAAHPDDEDTNLIAWLARGRNVNAAYMSLTRGDGGQNLIGNELGEALGVIRTEELLQRGASMERTSISGGSTISDSRKRRTRRASTGRRIRC